MRDMSVTAGTFQELRDRSKEVAPLNMSYMSVTAETSHPVQVLPLKEVAPSNMLDMSVTAETLQELRDRSKEVAS